MSIMSNAGSASRIVVRLPALLVNMFPSAERRLEVTAETVEQMIDALDSRWPGMRDCLCDSTPAIRRHINVFVAGKRATLATRLTAGADVFILTAISGG
jgi:molybdopterin converting factor small subunit